jgi:hypothetical protein
MQVILNIPDDIVHQLTPDAASISSVIIENMASQAYRATAARLKTAFKH